MWRRRLARIYFEPIAISRTHLYKIGVGELRSMGEGVKLCCWEDKERARKKEGSVKALHYAGTMPRIWISL